MKLSEILKGISAVENDVEINSIQFDSRKVENGDVFVAARGTAADGHNFIKIATEKGAAAIVFDNPEAVSGDKNVIFIKVKNSSEVLGKMASNFYGNPSQKLKLAGVTGTNGKTTVATLLYQLFMKKGIKAGLLSTVKNYICEKEYETINTTPNPLEINRLLAEMVENGCKCCFMEVSSHAVVQHRISGLEFACGIFTNLTRDHLDYHGTMDKYRDAKKMFFDNLPKTAFALTNIDDKNGEFMLQNCKARKFTYSLRTAADFKTKIIESDFEGMNLELQTANHRMREFYTPLTGAFNAYNLTAVYGTAVLLSIIFNDSEKSFFEHEIYNSVLDDAEEILTDMSKLHPVSGRFETIRGNGITAIVDYAHTPDALKNVLSTIGDIIKNSNGHLITVVGCGGNRDKGKRPLMAKEAANQSHTAIFTSDNPRNENPDEILADMLAGLDEKRKENVLIIEDRRQAIKTAVKLAAKGDVILIAGKGHEDYQIIGSEKLHFDDREEVSKCIEMRG